MRAADQIITTFNYKILRALMPQGVPVVTIYGNPADYPGKFVARLFNGTRPTNIIAIADTLDDIREAKPDNMQAIPRTEQDAREIIEMWI